MTVNLSPQKRADRVFFGILPEIFDRIDIARPDPVTDEFMYSYLDENSGAQIVSAIIRVVYLDSTKSDISSVARLI